MRSQFIGAKRPRATEKPRPKKQTFPGSYSGVSGFFWLCRQQMAGGGRWGCLYSFTEQHLQWICKGLRAANDHRSHQRWSFYSKGRKCKQRLTWYSALLPKYFSAITPFPWPNTNGLIPSCRYMVSPMLNLTRCPYKVVLKLFFKSCSFTLQITKLINSHIP